MEELSIKSMKDLMSFPKSTGNGHKKCTMCKLVTIFTYVVLILTLVFVLYAHPRFFARSAPSQMPIQETIPLTGAEIDQRMLDLKGAVAVPANPHLLPTIDGVQSGGGGGIPKKEP